MINNHTQKKKKKSNYPNLLKKVKIMSQKHTSNLKIKKKLSRLCPRKSKGAKKNKKEKEEATLLPRRGKKNGENIILVSTF